MAETATAFSWIYSLASADSALVAAATGGLFMGIADIGVTAPFMSYSRQSGADKLTLQAVRIWTDILMLIKAVGPTTGYPALVTIAGRIDALFRDVRNAQVPGGGGAVLACYREQEFAMNELVNGVQWSHLGGLYRIELQGS